MVLVDDRNLAAADAAPLAEARRPPLTAQEELLRSFVSAAPSEDSQAGRGTSRGNVLVLALTAFLFGLITATQWYFAAVVTRSRALVADCHCMLVDSLTYFLNMWVELAPRKIKTPLRLTVPIISLTVLAVLTAISLQDAMDVFDGHGKDDGVSPWVVWCFGFAGLLFDCIAIYAFWRNKRRGALPVNMLTAFMHVGADFIRSLTTTVEGALLFIFKGWNGEMIDAVSCVVIVIIIFIGILYGIYEVLMDIRAYCKKRRSVSHSVEVPKV